MICSEIRVIQVRVSVRTKEYTLWRITPSHSYLHLVGCNPIHHLLV